MIPLFDTRRNLFDTRRNCYVCFVKSAAKDNEVVKKGESYYWVKKTKYASKEFFKSVEDLNKEYPNRYVIKFPDLVKLLNTYKKKLKTNPNLSPKKFLNNNKID
jgi:hypothetical protein